MMVMGVVKQMTTESAFRAALGAGAIVMDSVSADDGREDFERIERIRHIRPDIVLITGGVDGGARTHVVEMAEMLVAAQPRPRFGNSLKLPVIYAGNSEAVREVCQILEASAQVLVVENVRPVLERENLGPARQAIHEFFLEHVMSHSPGYTRLLQWSPVPIMPTPAAVGDMVLSHARQSGLQVLCADIGGATTDVFSVFRDRSGQAVFNRTVSANLGMSYSMANVLLEAGVDAIARWLPYEMSENELRDRLRNKMIRPTSIPQTREDLWLEQAVCREALRLSLEHHRALAVGLSGTQKQRGIADVFSQERSRYELVDLMALDLVIGSGGVLSHAPDRMAAALMMMDGFALCGTTELVVDSVFMMPHLGVFSAQHPEAAREIFLNDCLVKLGHSVAPVYPANWPAGRPLLEGGLSGQRDFVIMPGEVKRLDLPAGQKFTLRLKPAGRGINAGASPGRILEKEIIAGSCGLVLDGRNRPIVAAANRSEQVIRQRNIFSALGLI